MEFTSLGVSCVTAIMIICYLIGMAIKVTPLDNKYIPVIVGVAGGVLGLVGLHIIPDFPAADYMTAVAVGIASGLSAVGINQIGKQLGGGA